MLRHPFCFRKMAFRTIYIEKAVKVKLDLNNIVVYYDNSNYYINIDEVSTIIFDDPRCNISLKLLSLFILSLSEIICPISCITSYLFAFFLIKSFQLHLFRPLKSGWRHLQCPYIPLLRFCGRTELSTSAFRGKCKALAVFCFQ